MAYDVASSINDLLFSNESVIIPGFGGFVLNEHSANIDYIKSTITPPSKIPSFNKNLTLNDGILVDYIKNQNRCTLEQANQIVKDFVEDAERKIEAKEIIEFPKVGRLYKDYSKSLQFLPYDTNFNTNAFGLPVIEVHPFSRNATSTTSTSSINTATTATATAAATVATATAAKVNEVKTSKVETPVLETPTKMKEEDKKATIPLGDKPKRGILYWVQKTLPFLLIASLIFMAASYFMMRKGGDSKLAKASTTGALIVDGEKKINTAPSIEEAEITPITDSEDSDISYSGSDDEDSNSSDADNSTSTYDNEDSGDSSSGVGRECIVIVGQFSDKANARRYAEQVENDGFESYMGWNSDKGWNTVGVKFSFESESEKNKIHRTLKNKYDKAAWILRD